MHSLSLLSVTIVDTMNKSAFEIKNLSGFQVTGHHHEKPRQALKWKTRRQGLIQRHWRASAHWFLLKGC